MSHFCPIFWSDHVTWKWHIKIHHSLTFITSPHDFDPVFTAGWWQTCEVSWGTESWTWCLEVLQAKGEDSTFSWREWHANIWKERIGEHFLWRLHPHSGWQCTRYISGLYVMKERRIDIEWYLKASDRRYFH